MKITTNKAMVDYFTVTTFSDELMGEWYDSLSVHGEMKREKRKRYEGWRGDGEYSSVFLGVGKQKGMPHYIIECSGAGSDSLLNRLVGDDLVHGRAKCTRIDVQVTIDQPVDWSQLRYEINAEKAGLKPTKRRSPDTVNGIGELITVYTGTRESGRFNRVYQKVMQSGELLLRFETQFGRGYAHAVAAELCAGKTGAESVVKGEIYRRGLEDLEVFDLWKCRLYQPKQEKKLEVDKRALWLVADVLPVFAEYINRHDADPSVVDMFVSVIMQSGTGCNIVE